MCLLLSMLGVVATSVPAHTEDPVFRSAADLVVLPVVVTDHNGRFVRDLQLHDFAVYEDGVRQTPSLFASNTAPLDLMVLLDTSGSMYTRLPFAKEGILNMLRVLRPGDEASVVLFNSSVRIAQPLTGDRSRLEAAVAGASPGGGTALYEAIYVAVRHLAVTRRDVVLRRQAIVVLSDGDDNLSRSVAFDDVREVARRSATTIFTIVLAPAESVPFQHTLLGRVTSGFEMRALAEDTGGRTFTPALASDLTRVYDDIVAELSEQYWLAYPAPSAGREGFRPVRVSVETHKGLRTRTRSGYYARRRSG